MLIGMAPHVASRKTANMLRDAVDELSKLKDEKQLRADIFRYFADEHGIPLMENEIDTVVSFFRT